MRYLYSSIVVPLNETSNKMGKFKFWKEAFNEKGSNLGTYNSWFWSLGRDLNPRPPPYQGDALTRLGHRGLRSLFLINLEGYINDFCGDPLSSPLCSLLLSNGYLETFQHRIWFRIFLVILEP